MDPHRVSGLWLALCLLGGCYSAPKAEPIILLITLDTTRADALGLYGQSPSPSPVLDQLGERSVIFDEVQTAVPLTLPTHSSIMTGLDPDHHGVRDNNAHALPKEAITLAERFSEAGWQTGAFPAAIVLDRVFGLSQGFDDYISGFDLSKTQEDPTQIAQWDATVIADRAISWLTHRDARPIFCWVHFYDAHTPYAPPASTRALFPEDPYLAEIAHVDATIGRLLTAFRATGRPLTVVVVGDHGESLGEHGETAHGQLLYRSTTRVPLIWSSPDVTHTQRISTLRGVVDIAPTLLRRFGLSLDATDGIDLFNSQPRLSYAETLYPKNQFGFASLHALQDDHYRLINAPRPELFAWHADPGELDNLWNDPAHAEAQERLINALRSRGAGQTQRAVIPPNVSAQLAQLGYLPGAITSNDTPRLVDPKDFPNIEHRWERALFAARQLPPLQGVEALREFSSEFPHLRAAQLMIARGLEAAGDIKGARDTLTPLLTDDPDNVQLLGRVAELEMKRGDFSDALEHLKHAKALMPTYAIDYAITAEVHRRMGRPDLALAEITDGLKQAPESTRLRLLRGTVMYEFGNLQASETDLRFVLLNDPQNTDVRFLLGRTLAASHQPIEAVDQLNEAPPSEASAHLLGQLLYSQGRYSEAAPHLKSAHPQNDDSCSILYADTLLRLGATHDTVRALLKEQPLTELSHRVHAAMLVKEGKITEALRHTQEANNLSAITVDTRPSKTLR